MKLNKYLKKLYDETYPQDNEKMIEKGKLGKEKKIKPKVKKIKKKKEVSEGMENLFGVKYNKPKGKKSFREVGKKKKKIEKDEL